jgi:hypothetical protein
MFPKSATSAQLADITRKFGDVKGETRFWPAPMCRFQKGQHWQFWMEGDPRAEDGILPLADYVCTESGDDCAQWRKV